MALFDSLIKPALDSVTKIIGEFHESPAEKASALQAVNDAAAKMQAASMDYDVKLNDIAGQNIRTEESSADPFVRRSRPGVIWMGNLLIMWNYGIVPVIGHHWGLTTLPIPDAFFWTWGTVVTGYVFSRGAEKIAAMPGDSQINVAGLVKLGNKN